MLFCLADVALPALPACMHAKATAPSPLVAAHGGVITLSKHNDTSDGITSRARPLVRFHVVRASYLPHRLAPSADVTLGRPGLPCHGCAS